MEKTRDILGMEVFKSEHLHHYVNIIANLKRAITEDFIVEDRFFSDTNPTLEQRKEVATETLIFIMQFLFDIRILEQTKEKLPGFSYEKLVGLDWPAWNVVNLIVDEEMKNNETSKMN